MGPLRLDVGMHTNGSTEVIGLFEIDKMVLETWIKMAWMGLKDAVIICKYWIG
jgi:hypothetical protein